MTVSARSLEGKHVVLGITGGIAAYKSAFLLRMLVKRGAEVQVVMTPSAKEFITPVTLSALSGKPVVSEFFTANTGEWHSHVDLGIWADLMIVAPATASTIGKMAHGIADNMLVTTYLSAKEHVMIAPAMDLDMYKSPSTLRNLDLLRHDGVGIIEAECGELASGFVGKGRMAEPETIVEAVERFFARRGSLDGKRILVTAGPTFENIDPVRFIGNYSSGKMGFAIASAAAARGAEVTLVSGPVSLRGLHPAVRRVDVVSARDMLAACEDVFDSCDCAVLAAAVADYAPENASETKIKREGKEEMVIRLVRNPDIAAALGRRKGERRLVGFALETDNEQANALRKMETKNLDMIVLNSLRDPEAGFMKNTNKITILSRDGAVMRYPAKSKTQVAEDILDAVFATGL